MKTPEKVVLIVITIGILFKILMWPLSGFFLTISLLAYTLLHFPGGFYLLSGKIKAEKSALPAALTGMCLALIPAGILFRLQFWPGGQALLIQGIIAAIIILIVIIIMKSRASTDLQQLYRNLLIRIIVFISVGVVISLISVRMLISLKNHRDSELTRLKIQSYENPDNIIYREALINYQNKKDSSINIDDTNSQ